MVDKLLNQILAETYTKEQALIRLQVLKNLVLFKLFGRKSREETAAAKPRPVQQTPWIISLGPGIYRSFNRDNVYKIFNDLEAAIKNIQPLVIYLPIEIPEAELQVLGQKLRSDYGSRFLFEVQTDPSLIAGAALVWKGIYKDYSVRKKIADNREMILSALKEFIREEKGGSVYK